MSEERNVRVVVFAGERYDGDWPPEDPAGFLAWFQEKINEIPLEHHAEARIEIGSESGYEGDHYASLEITYWRPETDEETFARKATEASRARARQAEELRMLNALKAKYEPT